MSQEIKKEDVVKRMKRESKAVTLTQIEKWFLMNRIESSALLNEMVTLGLIRKNSKGRFVVRGEA